MFKIDKKINSQVLVIGSGGAGLRTAIQLHENKVDVIVVGKCKKRDAHTSWARGGINAALANMDEKDKWQMHAADTIMDGGYINDPDAVTLLAKNAPDAVNELKKWGTPFEMKNGKIAQRFFGAARYRRACFVGDITGQAILNTLVDQVVKRKIKFKSEVYIFSLLENQGSVNGALGLEIRTGKIIQFSFKAVVIATGGHSKMFHRSSSRIYENNGDGIYLCNELGAKFMDMEMFQFHPTGMVYPKSKEGILVTEAVRGEGGRLFNAKGQRFMSNYDKKRMELSARDIVARANYDQIIKGNGTKHGGVYVDITHLEKSYIKKRLPTMFKQFSEIGIDISKERMEVAPTAHYSMGGLLVDHKTGKTTLSNVYAVGEVTSGLHGGNRLGGNSLAELIVFGKITGNQIAKDIKKIKQNENVCVENALKKLNAIFNSKGTAPLKAKIDLQKVMNKAAGVIRSEKTLKWGLKEINKLEKKELRVKRDLKNNADLIEALDFRNMIPTCKMILISALMRKESRAAHFRSDYKNTKKSMQKNIVIEKNDGKNKESRSRSKLDEFKLTWRPIKEVPKQIQKYMKVDHKYHYLE